MNGDIVDRLPRAAKLFIDDGRADSVEAAIETLTRFRVHLHIGEAAARSPTHQATLLTAIACARRCLLGGVTVDGDLDVPLATRVGSGATLGAAAIAAGAVMGIRSDAATPLVTVGSATARDAVAVACPGFAIRTTFDGWRAGITPASETTGLSESREFELAGALAGALAVAEVFAHLDGDILAGIAPKGMSLWDQDAGADWLDAASDGPEPTELPADLWLIGLGHLGQAFLWAIALLPYVDTSAVRLWLQDTDAAGGSTFSTSVVTEPADAGRPKTRICAEWAEARRFKATLIERRFGPDLRVADREPALALCGVDNPDARRILDGAGFAMAFEAGLGSGAGDFRLIRTHSFPAERGSQAVWPTSVDPSRKTGLEAKAAYGKLAADGELDACGLTRLAEVAVGAPFVGMAAAAILVAQVLRAIAGGGRPVVANVDLRTLADRSAVYDERPDIVTFATSPSAAAGKPRSRPSRP